MRNPLRPIPEAERVKKLEAMGLDAECIPYNLNPSERAAARNPGLPAAKEVKHMGTPIVSGKAAVVAGFLATAFGALASLAPGMAFMPSWAPFALWAAASICAFLVGLQLKPYEGGLVVAQKAVPALLAVAAGLGTVAESLAPGSLPKSAVGFAALIVLALTGKGVPVQSKEQLTKAA